MRDLSGCSFFIRMLTSSMRAPPSYPSHHPKPPSLKSSHWGLGFQHKNCAGVQIFSPQQIPIVTMVGMGRRSKLNINTDFPFFNSFHLRTMIDLTERNHQQSAKGELFFINSVPFLYKLSSFSFATIPIQPRLFCLCLRANRGTTISLHSRSFSLVVPNIPVICDSFLAIHVTVCPYLLKMILDRFLS